MDKISDQWQTPMALFNVLDKGGIYQGIPFDGFNFDIDLCATRENSKCNHLCWDFLNSLTGSKDSNCIGTIYDDVEAGIINVGFMNPPYSNPRPFIEKAWEHSKIMKIVCLVKCDPSTRWWATFWDYNDLRCKICGWDTDGCDHFEDDAYWYNGPKPGCDYVFFPKRIKFDPPQQLIDSGEVWEEGADCPGCTEGMTGAGPIEAKIILNCKSCSGKGILKPKWAQRCNDCATWCSPNNIKYDGCTNCKGKGYKELSGPNFSCALLIFDRRGL